MDQFSNPQGADRTTAGVRYRVWAPKVVTLAVEIQEPSGSILRSVELAQSGGGFFEGFDASGKTGDRYKYRLDGEQHLPDPASRWQPDGVHGSSMVINPADYRWEDSAWKPPHFRDLVIYELHVGAFSAEGTFRSAIEKLEHVRDLGATAIELMPVSDFPGSWNWGYDGVYLFAPSRAYGHPDNLRALVDAAHGLGLAVILDVVYNHLGPDGNYLHAYIGEYLDEGAKTPWGGAIRYGDPKFKPFRDLVVSNPAYWMREFHIDGFRLDATHAIIDQSPRHILQELTAVIHAHGGFAIAEDPRNEARVILPEAEGGLGFDASWADDFHHIVRVGNTHESEGYFSDFKGSLCEAVDVLDHGWHYRGHYSKSGGKERGTACHHIPPERFVHCLSNHDQIGNHPFGERFSQWFPASPWRAAEALLCLSPYTPMIFMGQEWGASTPFHYFTDHNAELGRLIIAGRRDEFKDFAGFSDPALLDKLPNPQRPATFEMSKLQWDQCNQPEHSATLALYRECLSLRASDAAFRPVGRTSWRVEKLAMGAGAIRLQSDGGDWLLIFDLQGGHSGSLRDEPILKPSAAGWNVVLFSNDLRFGGTGHCGIDVASMEAAFDSPATVVLREMLHADRAS